MDSLDFREVELLNLVTVPKALDMLVMQEVGWQVLESKVLNLQESASLGHLH